MERRAGASLCRYDLERVCRSAAGIDQGIGGAVLISHFDAMLLQNEAIAKVNMLREGDAFVMGAYASGKPEKANHLVAKYLRDEQLAFCSRGGLTLTHKGRALARELAAW